MPAALQYKVQDSHLVMHVSLQWLARTILIPVAREIENVNAILSKNSCPEQIGGTYMYAGLCSVPPVYMYMCLKHLVCFFYVVYNLYKSFDLMINYMHVYSCRTK